MTPADGKNPFKIECHEIRPEETISLRHLVLWPDMPISHVMLPEDQNGAHLGAFITSNENPVAVISLFLEPVPEGQGLAAGVSTEAQARFRKFACDPPWQGRGVGSELLKFAFEWMKKEHGCKLIWCDARTSSSAWYIKRGMTPFGDKFYKGPIEYTRMYIDY